MKKVMKVDVEGKSVVEEMEGLKDYQKFVGGYIEIPHISKKLYEKKIDVIINEEGKLLELKPTFAIVHEGKIIDLLCGNVIFASHDIKGNTTSLSMSQVQYLIDNVISKRGFININNELVDIGIIEF